MGDEIYIYVFIGIPLSLFLTYWFIKSAAGTKRRESQLKLQNKLLIEMLKQNGYTDEKMLNYFEVWNNED